MLGQNVHISWTPCKHRGSCNVNMLDVWTVLRNDRFHPGSLLIVNSDIEQSLSTALEASPSSHVVPLWLKLIKVLCTPRVGQCVLYMIKQGLNLALVTSFANMRESTENSSDTILLFFITMTVNVIL